MPRQFASLAPLRLTVSASAQSFRPLGHLSNGLLLTNAENVSDDGSTVFTKASVGEVRVFEFRFACDIGGVDITDLTYFVDQWLLGRP